MANIVSMKSITALDGVRVTMDTDLALGIFVTLKNGDIFNFEPYVNGLYYLNLDTLTNQTNTTKIAVNNYSLLQTAKENKSFSLLRKLKERMHQENFKNICIIPVPKL